MKEMMAPGANSFTFHLAKIKISLLEWNLWLKTFLFGLLLDIFANGVLFVKHIPGSLI